MPPRSRYEEIQDGVDLEGVGDRDEDDALVTKFVVGCCRAEGVDDGVDLEGLRDRDCACVTDLVASEPEDLQDGVDLQSGGQRLGALVADVVVAEGEVLL